MTRSLTQTLPKKWWIGRVKYIDRETYEGMNAYTGSQANLRAFLKGLPFAHENELRVATMNFVVAGCLNPDGSPPTEKQQRGYIDVTNGPGIYVAVDLNMLVSELRTAPGADFVHKERVEAMLLSVNCTAAVRQSAL